MTKEECETSYRQEMRLPGDGSCAKLIMVCMVSYLVRLNDFLGILVDVCPVLCSGRGTYGGGRCHCESGWAGPECDLPFTEFDLPFISCSIPCSVHGKCVNGRCQCQPGYTGASCETGKSSIPHLMAQLL